MILKPFIEIEVLDVFIIFPMTNLLLASVCLKHGVFQSRRSKKVTVASDRLSTSTKETIFPSEHGFVC